MENHAKIHMIAGNFKQNQDRLSWTRTLCKLILHGSGIVHSHVVDKFCGEIRWFGEDWRIWLFGFHGHHFGRRNDATSEFHINLCFGPPSCIWCTSAATFILSVSPKSRIPANSWPYLDQEWLRIQLLATGLVYIIKWNTASHAPRHQLHFT